jgi:superfamily II DNA or RNA helicase
MIRVEQFNETHMRVLIDDFGIEQEVKDFFTFFAPGYKFHPKVKAKIWDGKISLFDTRKKTLYKGLVGILVKFCRDRCYEFSVDKNIDTATDVTEEQIRQFVDSLNLSVRGNKLEIREYQYQAIHKSIESKRNLLLSPTSSGKSLILYSKIRFHLDTFGHRVLVVVPTTMLVEQLYSDFEDYSSNNGWAVEDNVQTLYSGKEKLFSANVMISTWQSLTAMMKNQPREFADLVSKVDVALFDEAHTYKATAVLQTMEKFTQTEWRTGTTGTIDSNKINELCLIGLMGPIYKVITTKQLMDAGQVTDLKIKALMLTYPEHVRKEMKGMKYQDEVEFIIASDARNKFIANLANACQGNTLILFNYVERHGAVLYELIKQKVAKSKRGVYFIHGGTDVSDRETIRNAIDKEDSSIIIATASLFSTGVNIPSIENIIFAVPSKSTIRIRQSIGRGLRLKEGKTKCTLFDIVDNLSYKTWMNTTLKHFQERVTIYDSEQFNWELMKIDL